MPTDPTANKKPIPVTVAEASIQQQSAMQQTVLLERMDQIRTVVGELSGRVGALTDSMQGFQLHYVEEHTKLVGKVESANNRIDEHDEEIEKLQGDSTEMKTTVKTIAEQVKDMKMILGWIGGAFGVLVIGLLFAILTHQVTITFP